MNLKLEVFRNLSRLPGFAWGLNGLRDYHSLFRGMIRGTYAQHGEDLFLAEYFAGRTGVYLDIGASHPFRISNTYLLYRQGWSGVTVEPIEQLYLKHKRWRVRDQQCCEAVGEVSGELTFYELIPSVLSTFDSESASLAIKRGGVLKRQRLVNMTTISDIMQKYFFDKQIDLLSIDAEGLDYAILAGNNWNKYRPRIVLFEKNDSGSDLAESLLLKNHYRILHNLGCNRIFERIDS